MNNLEHLYCKVDDFCQQFIPAWRYSLLQSGEKHRHKPGRLSESEVITLLILFHQLRHRDFKTFYTHYAQHHLKAAFIHAQLSDRSFLWCYYDAVLY